MRFAGRIETTRKQLLLQIYFLKLVGFDACTPWHRAA